MSNTERCLDFCKKLGQNNIDNLLPFLDNNVLIEHPAIPEAVLKNKQAFADLMKTYYQWATEGQVEILRSTEDGNSVWVERIDRWKIENKWVDVPITAIFDFKDNLIVHWREYLDFGYMNQFKTRPGDALHEGADHNN